MCGIVGFCNEKEAVSKKIFKSLNILQHRGSDSCGISTFENRFYTHKKSGKVREVFNNEILNKLKGKSGIGHVRYATQGANNDEEAQPFFISYPFGISMVHNGNITNRREIQKKLENQFFSIKKTNDVELILFTFANELKKINLSDINENDIFNALTIAQNTLKGAYSVISQIGNKGMLAFKDQHGIRPLVFGRKIYSNNHISYGFASETIALTRHGYEIIKELQPSEAIFIDNYGNIHSKILKKEKKEKICIFEYIYFAKPESIINNLSIAKEREKYGELIADSLKKHNIKADFITEIPETAYFSAISLSKALNIPYKKVIIKNNNIGRSFILPNQKSRETVLQEKFTIIEEFVKDKVIVIVDDSIVRGTTAKHIIKLMKIAGAKKIYMISTSPMIKYPCVYGIDMSISNELIAHNKNKEEIRDILGVDELFYLELNDLKNFYKNYNFCDACFSGNYPTDISLNDIKQIETERLNNREK